MHACRNAALGKFLAHHRMMTTAPEKASIAVNRCNCSSPAKDRLQTTAKRTAALRVLRHLQVGTGRARGHESVSGTFHEVSKVPHVEDKGGLDKPPCSSLAQLSTSSLSTDMAELDRPRLFKD